MKRSGFTMIELIFVIVILGILASVAIPKLAATRDDAKVSKALNELAMLKNDFASYYTSQGTYKANNINDLTNVVLYTDNCTTQATSIKEDGSVSYKYCADKTGGGLEPIATFTPNDTNGALTIAKVNATGNVGKSVQLSTSFNSLIGTVNNGGSRVSY